MSITPKADLLRVVHSVFTEDANSPLLGSPLSYPTDSNRLPAVPV